MAHRLVIPAVAAVVVAADQTTKTWALHHAYPPRHVVGTLYWWLTFNPGAAFGLGRGVTPVVEAVVVALIVVLLAMSGRASRHATPLMALGMGLLLGGAFGNLADRLFRHHHGDVIDFIRAVSWWPIFNLADVSIVVGVIILVLSYSLRPAARS